MLVLRRVAGVMSTLRRVTRSNSAGVGARAGAGAGVAVNTGGARRAVAAKAGSAANKLAKAARSKPQAATASVKRARTAGAAATGSKQAGGKAERQYWLFKSEPDPRTVKGVDVSFSLDAFEKESAEEGSVEWDGVRNAEASKLMRDVMRVGDLGFFYHSNTKTPGIVGVCKVAKEGYPDPCAWDKADPHYDPKTDPAKPKWFRVDITFVRRMRRIVSLHEIKATPELQDMALVRRGRLSVQPVKPSEWDLIMALEQEDDES